MRAVSPVPEDELQAALGRLVASELVFQRGTPPEAVYSFKHAWCRTRRTAVCCAVPGSNCIGRSPKRSKSQSPELLESQPDFSRSIMPRPAWLRNR